MTQGKTILLVDDSSRIRPLVREILKELNCQILEAGSAEEAMEVAASQSGALDLLLTDIAMPGISGLELAAELRRNHPRLKVLFMSGHLLPSATSADTYFIEKPFRPDTLLTQVRALLDTE